LEHFLVWSSWAIHLGSDLAWLGFLQFGLVFDLTTSTDERIHFEFPREDRRSLFEIPREDRLSLFDLSEEDSLRSQGRIV